jgi:hypothetical protein
LPGLNIKTGKTTFHPKIGDILKKMPEMNDIKRQASILRQKKSSNISLIHYLGFI